MLNRVRKLSTDRARFNITAIMAKLSNIPPDLIQSACLYTGREPFEAVCHVLNDYPRLIADLRSASRRLAALDSESASLDARLDALHLACQQILDL
ncbi:MAG: hypothetical protein [Inoviridae sp.]|nr:MAG: hypothetical protein [Inoviridae sp.]